MDEEKLELKPEQFEQINADNQISPPELENFRSDYAKIFSESIPNVFTSIGVYDPLLS